MRGRPTGFWAKLEQDDAGETTAWHPLAAHSADVAAVTEALLQRTILRKRLAHLIGWDVLSDVHVARLSALTALHDAGKVNHGFQNRASDAPGPRGGHVSPIVEVLASESAAKYLTPLGVAPMLAWFSSERDLAHFLLATFGHHGRPVLPKHNFKENLWQANERRDPMAELEEMAGRVRAWFPRAFGEARPFPTDPPLQHAFNGLLTLADWLGSDRRFFDFADDAQDPMPRARKNAAGALKALALDPSGPRRQLGGSPVGFDAVSKWNPYEMQKTCLDLPLDEEGSLTVLESDTGSGKTEAALARFVRLYQAGLVDGMYFAVPTRSAATQLYRRVVKATARAFPDASQRPPVVQAVPGYINVDTVEGVPLPRFKVQWPDDHRDALRSRGWAPQLPKRYLAGAIVVGTVDQALLSALEAKHAHMRAAALLRHFLVVDEVHASDVYMTALMDRVLDQHLAAGGHALLMSATLGTAARIHLTTAGRQPIPPVEEAENIAYPLITHVDASRGDPSLFPVASSGQSKRVETELQPLAGDPQAIAEHALEKAHAGARVLIIRNTVADCVATQHTLEDVVGDDVVDDETDLLFGIGDTPAPHHSRFAPEDRKRLDQAIEEAFGKETTRRAIMAVATQTVEQSLDIDADLLITDLCPIDVLLQRIGRLHRHDRVRPAGFETTRCVVLTPQERDLESAITADGRGLHGKHGLGTVYQDLRVLEATWRVLEDDVRGAWHIPADNRPLVEHGTHPGRLDELVGELGGRWQAHWEHILGRNAADRQLPALVGIKRHKPFGDSAFAEDLGKVKTRLGCNDYRVELPDPVPGPFGAPVDELTVTEWQLDQIPEDTQATAVTPFEGGFRFVFCGHTFQYDRFGLTPVASS